MENERILANWETVLASLPPTAKVVANFKTFKLPEYPNAKPEYANIEFDVDNQPNLNFTAKRLEVIRIEAEYRKNGYYYETQIELFSCGAASIVKEFGPSGETPERLTYPRFYPKEGELADILAGDKAIFMREWLLDMIKVIAETPRITGNVVIANCGTEKIIPDTIGNPVEWAECLLGKAKRGKYSATSFDAVFERENGIRTDFIDRITIKVKPNRTVTVNYSTIEKEGFYRQARRGESPHFSSVAQKVIGAIREARNLALISSIFPDGFAERTEADFLYRCNNFSEDTHEYRPWPNRQCHA